MSEVLFSRHDGLDLLFKQPLEHGQPVATVYRQHRDPFLGTSVFGA